MLASHPFTRSPAILLLPTYSLKAATNCRLTERGMIGEDGLEPGKGQGEPQQRISSPYGSPSDERKFRSHRPFFLSEENPEHVPGVLRSKGRVLPLVPANCLKLQSIQRKHVPPYSSRILGQVPNLLDSSEGRASDFGFRTGPFAFSYSASGSFPGAPTGVARNRSLRSVSTSPRP